MEQDPQNTDFTKESNSSENQNNNNNSTGNAEKGNPESNTYYRKRTYDNDGQNQNSNTYYKKPQQYNNDGQNQNSNTYYKKPQQYNNDGGNYNQNSNTYYKKPQQYNNDGQNQNSNTYYKKPQQYNNDGQNQNSNTYYKKPQQYNNDGQNQNSNTYYKKPQQYNNDGQNQNSNTYYKKPQQYNNDGQNQNSNTYYKKPQQYNNNGGGNYQNNNNYQRRPYNNNQGGGGYNQGGYNQGGGGYNQGGGYNNNQRRPFNNNRNNNYNNNYNNEPLETYTHTPVLPNEREDKEGMRVNKYIAHAGLCARRKADDFIRAGRIYINGEVMDQVGYRVKATDVVTLDGANVKPTKKYVYILLNKPRNVISTADDEQGRRTVMDLITPLTEERVYPVGRLDRDTTGLVLLTNDGELAQRLAQPSHEVKKIYEITLDKPLEESDLEKIRQTVELEDGAVHVDRVEYVHDSPPNVIGMELSAGRNRVVRRLFEHLGYRVTKLDRVKYAMLTKKGLPRGKCRFLDVREINMLKYLF
jgi:23S rRNA pseudouridine2605 synthase